MRPPPRLTTCYTPLPCQQDGKFLTMKQRQERVLNQRDGTGNGGGDNGKVNDSRSAHSLRRLLLESNVVGRNGSVAGSALVELGHTKVLCTVTGPVTSASSVIPSSVPLSLDRGTLYVEVKYVHTTGFPDDILESVRSIETHKSSNTSATSQGQRKSASQLLASGVQTRETDLATKLMTALEAAVPLTSYPKCAIVLHVTVLQDDGNMLAATVTAATMALVDAGMELYDVVTACSVAVLVVEHSKMEKSAGGDTKQSTVILLADPTAEETRIADSIVTLAILPNWKEVSFWEQLGTNPGTNHAISQSTVNDAINLCRDGCRTMHKFLREHWLHDLTRESKPKASSSSDAMDETK